MRRCTPALALVAALSAAPVLADPDSGRRIYEESCAGCHGAKGAGDGWMGKYLTRRPAPLDRLAAANGGVFPAARVEEAIDGRKAVALHGPREMPVWGKVFEARSRGDTVRPEPSTIVRFGAPRNDTPRTSEDLVVERVRAVREYLQTLQVSP